jgi:integrase/recombinase XerD
VPKQNRSGQARIFSELEYRKFRNQVTNKTHRLCFDVAWWTGERMGAIVQLRVENVYKHPETSEPREFILYPASTRKDARTREVEVHPQLESELRLFRPPSRGYLFGRARDPARNITRRDIDQLMRWYLLKCGWNERGYSTHSFRRSFITRLHERGTDPILMQQLTGHASLANMMRYVEVDPKRVAQALRSL